MGKTVKVYSDTYIYNAFRSEYEKKLFNYLMSAKVINKESEQFRDAVHDVKKRAVSSAFVDCMLSDNVIFLDGECPNPFVVMTAKDVRRRATHESYVNKVVAEAEKSNQTPTIGTISGTNAPMTNKKTNTSENVKPVQSGGNLVYDDNFIPYSAPPIVFKEDVAVASPLKVFINARGLFDTNGNLRQPEILIAHLNNAIVNLLYYKMPEKLFSFNNMDYGAACFSKLFLHILEYIAKISNMDNAKPKCEYAVHKYFYKCVAYFNNNGSKTPSFDGSVRSRVLKDAGISEREADIVDTQIEDDDYGNIKLFVEALSDMIKVPGLTIDAFTEKWMWLYGGARVAFGLEYFPSFSSMITDAYHGVYLNNQKTIEKVCGNNMVGYTKAVSNTIG